MKFIYAVAFICILAACAKSTSTETAAPDSVVNIASIDAVNTNAPEKILPEKTVLAISDSASSAINERVNKQFDSLFLALADSASYYRVAMTDYFDEWEGQNEGTHIIFYFDKEFTVVYSKHIYESGSMDGRNTKEYGLKNNTIAFSKEDTDSNTYEERTLTLYNRETGGAQLNTSTYDNTVNSTKPLPDNYLKDTQNDWNLCRDDLKSFIRSQPEEKMSKDGDTYTVLLQVPKPAELMDYTRVIIPKPVYNKLRNDNE